MPRESPFTITLTDEEERDLRQMSRKYTLPYFLVQRTQMILLAAEGLQNKEIAARLRTRREVVSQWRKRFFYKRLEVHCQLNVSEVVRAPRWWAIVTEPWPHSIP